MATQLNSETFRPVVDWFQTLAIMGPGGLPPTFTAESIRKDENVRKRVVRLLQDADISVTDVMTREKSLGVDSLREQLPPELIREITSSGKETVDLLSIQFAHHPTGVEKPLFLDLEDESDGTKRLFALAWPWLDVLDRNMVLVVDELDRSLHPLLVASLIRRINSEGDSGSAKRAQLVATVHDANLLQEVLGREQVWLTNKSRSTEATTITPLSDFRPRKSESLIRGYLGGRYGGTPIITETPLGD